MLILNKTLLNFFTRISSKNQIGKFFEFVVNEKAYFLLDNSEINHLAMGKNGLIEYSLNHKDLVLDDNLEWSKQNRQEGKPSKIIRKIIKKEHLKLFTEKDFEEFANLYKSKGLDVNYEFQLVKGLDIHHTYMMQQTEPKGTLSNSCMNKNIRMFGLYVCNPDVVSMVRLIDKSTNKLAGRALIWNLDNGETFMDRVYTVDDFLFELFYDYAKENNITYRKAYQNHSSLKDFIDLRTGATVKKNFEITLNTDFGKSPYLDTFRYGRRGIIFNTNHSDSEHEYNSPSGVRNILRGVRDTDYPLYDLEGNQTNLVQITEGQYEGAWVERELSYEVEGEIYHIEDEDIVRSDIEDRYIFRDYAIFCTDIDDYIHEDSIYYYVNERDVYYYNDDSLVQIEGEYYHEDDTIEVNGDYYLSDSDEIVETIDGDLILRDEAIYVEDDCYHELDERIVLHTDGHLILREDSVTIDDEIYHTDEVVEDIDGNNILINNSIVIDGSYYSLDDDRLTINEQGETILR